MAAQDLSFDRLISVNRKFGDPFLLPSNESMPTTLDTALDYAFFLYHLNPIYMQANIRVISHFITDVDYVGKAGDQREQEEHSELLKDALDIFGASNLIGQEHGCYGNSFARMAWPFDRFLLDERADTPRRYDLNIFGSDIKFNLKKMTYNVPDPVEMAKGNRQPKRIDLPFFDLKSLDVERIRIITMDPRHIHLVHSRWSHKTQILYKFDPDFIRAVKAGILHEVNETPIEVLRAISKDEDFLFNMNEVFHFKAPTIAGLSNNGWGVPGPILNYRSLHQLQVYRKIDEAVGLDYMLPFRILTPNPTTQISDATLNTFIGTFVPFAAEMIARRRQDPFAIHSTPFPVTMQEFGANGKSLAPKELVQYQTNDMLDSFGYPAELFRSTLQVEQIPTALRIFQNSFHFMYHGFDMFLRWVSRNVLDYLGREQLQVRLRPQAMANDLEEKQLYLQLAAGGEISRGTAYRPFNIDDPVEEARRRMLEDIEIQKAQMKAQQDFEREQTVGSMDAMISQSQQAAGVPAPGAPPGGVVTTPLDSMQEAQDLAMQALEMPQGDRTKFLNQIRSTAPEKHALVKQKMEEIRSQGESAGRQNATQIASEQQQGG